MSIVIVAGMFHEHLTERLIAGALDELRSAGWGSDQIRVIRVPGAFEIPWAVQQALHRFQPRGVIALGVIIQGETEHHHYLAQAVFQQLQHLATASGVPITLGILTTRDTLQALERAGGKHGHKGREAARALLRCFQALEA